MVAQPETRQSALPLDLFSHLHRVRVRYAVALKAAAGGDYSCESDLRTVSRLLGRLLAREAKKPREQRGGLNMLDISLAVDKQFPELRGWTRREIQAGERQRVLAMGFPGPKAVEHKSGRAS